MHWNYRVIEMPSGKLTVRELVYDDDETIIGYFNKVVGPRGEDRDELIEDMDRYMRSTFSPTLSYEDDDLEQTPRMETRPSDMYEWKDPS